MKKACVFVDGENFRHSIKDAFQGVFDPMDYLPRAARWSEFFDWMVGEAVDGPSERLRTYWYVLEHVDFYPYKFPNASDETDSLKVVLNKGRRTRDEIDGLEGDELVTKMNEIVTKLKEREQRFRGRFDGWHVIQNGIAGKHRAMEFRRAGAIRYNLFDKRMGQEKAVDVKLATDLIMLRGNYDVAVLVSGDQDYVPAVQAVKDAGKTVVNVAFEDQGGRLLPGGARRLNSLTDTSVSVPYDKLRDFLQI